ncbi:MAG: ABC transporter permease [Verrucomicrobiota bacterium]|nr:ABC transporter permease [Verrucomicrobiota bacterium]
MALPITYNIRNVLVRWRSTLATILGIALVVAVYMMVQALAVGLQQNSANTGDERNLLIVRKGSTAESSSQVTREQLQLLKFVEGIDKDAKGQPLISADVLVLINLPRKEGRGEANVLVRGVSPAGLELRPQVKLVEGRWLSPGKREVVASKRLAGRFAQLQIGDKFKTAGQELTVVGWLEAGKSAFDSEIWMDADEARSVFDREFYSTVLARVSNAAAAAAITNRLETDKRLPLRGLRETDYYKSQTMTATPIRFLGNFLATAMSVGAIFAAMNTMYASVGARTREVGTLRVLGYRRRTVLLSFLLEGAFLSLLGGILGCLLSLPMNGYSTGTLSFENFSEVVFDFSITPALIMKGLIFSVIVGLIGSLFPALRAARLPVIASLKSL